MFLIYESLRLFLNVNFYNALLLANKTRCILLFQKLAKFSCKEVFVVKTKPLLLFNNIFLLEKLL